MGSLNDSIFSGINDVEIIKTNTKYCVIEPEKDIGLQPTVAFQK